MHSEHRADFPSELLEGVSLKGKLHTDIYIADDMPISGELSFYKNSFLIVMKNSTPTFHYVDQTGIVAPAPLQGETKKIAEIIRNEMDRLDAADFYYIPRAAAEERDDIERIMAASKSDNKSAFILHGTNLYYVDKLQNKMEFLQKFNIADLAAIDEGLPAKIKQATEKIVVREQDRVLRQPLDGKQKAILTGMIDRKKRNIIQPLHIRTPIDRFFTHDSFQAVQSSLAMHIAQEEKKFYLYEAEVDPALYPPHRGDLIATYFETKSELAEKKMGDKVSELLDETCNEEKLTARAEQGVRTVKRSVTSLNWWVKVTATLMAAASPAPMDPNEKALGYVKKQVKKLHDDRVVQPRVDRAYQMTDDVTLRQMRGGGLEYELEHKDFGNPFNLMKVWIVSDVDPEMVASRGGISKVLGRSFVCASEEDARELARKMQQNREECERNLSAEPIQFEKFNGDKSHDKMLDAAMNDLGVKIAEQIGAYNSLIQRQQEYMADARALSSTKIAHKEYVHFKQIEDIQEQMLMVRCQYEECGRDLRKMNIAELNKEIKALYDLCQKYIEQHPYRNKDNDPVFNLFHRLESIKEAMPKAENAEEREPVAPLLASTKRSPLSR